MPSSCQVSRILSTDAWPIPSSKHEKTRKPMVLVMAAEVVVLRPLSSKDWKKKESWANQGEPQKISWVPAKTGTARLGRIQLAQPGVEVGKPCCAFDLWFPGSQAYKLIRKNCSGRVGWRWGAWILDTRFLWPHAVIKRHNLWPSHSNLWPLLEPSFPFEWLSLSHSLEYLFFFVFSFRQQIKPFRITKWFFFLNTYSEKHILLILLFFPKTGLTK